MTKVKHGTATRSMNLNFATNGRLWSYVLVFALSRVLTCYMFFSFLCDATVRTFSQLLFRTAEVHDRMAM